MGRFRQRDADFEQGPGFGHEAFAAHAGDQAGAKRFDLRVQSLQRLAQDAARCLALASLRGGLQGAARQSDGQAALQPGERRPGARQILPGSWRDQPIRAETHALHCQRRRVAGLQGQQGQVGAAGEAGDVVRQRHHGRRAIRRGDRGGH
ncbi:hypothetical protein G6F22_019860 [Rhizopus arrhizus]|nr:hypothetical protein G6F22_019860 [Rhizopus arrhizus]